ncbi:MAG: phosphoribosylaminoimidazolesuccinocarboxamide synthase [Spirochaetaceae bacterium]|nr:MAG: phosphoribosylaminoimidazolesuccinocarboxamide synthase [Spirochaetaceae bacterium]
MGSVKDLLVISPAFENHEGVGNFVFSDRYSVFDWGEMPDHIAGKGRALAAMAAFNFEQLERRGLRTHYQGLVGESGKLVQFSDLAEGQGGLATMQVSLARVYHPIVREFSSESEIEVRYDYTFFEKHRTRINNYLVGLEIIFRNGLPLGSSVFKRMERAEQLTDARQRRQELEGILKELGLRQAPQPGQMLPRPIMSFTTKLEAGDRELSEGEAYRLSGLRRRDFNSLKQLALQVNALISDQAERTGFVHYDGKIEAVWNNGLVVCDVIGTFDENRFSWQGEQISKEVLRQWYKRNQPEFVSACDTWKKTGPGWQKKCDVKPHKLPGEFAKLASQMYMSGCNRYTGKDVFDSPPLEEVMGRLKSFKD